MKPDFTLVLLLAACSPEQAPPPAAEAVPEPRVTPRVVYYSLGDP